MKKATIVMIEDNKNILENNSELLTLEGYKVLSARTLKEGQDLVEQVKPDLILLDIMLPDGNGMDYCRQLRGGSSIPILFLSALDGSDDKVEGLLSGGDGYMVKPYKNSELLAYIKALLRRTYMEEVPIRLGALELTFHPQCGYLNKKKLSLSPAEFSLLACLARNTSRFLPSEELYEKVWDKKENDDMRTVWEHISRLRKKLECAETVQITSKKGKGYRLYVQ